MVKAIVGYRLDKVCLGVLNFSLVNAQPFNESVLHYILCIGFATEQIIGNVVEQRLVERYGLSLVQFLIILIQQRYANFRKIESQKVYKLNLIACMGIFN